MVLVLVVLGFLSFVDTIPSQRQTQELMLLDALGRKGVMGSLEHTQGALIDMLGRSRFLLSYCFIYLPDFLQNKENN